MRERRNQFRCESCQTPMVFTGEVFVSKTKHSVYLTFICPRRTGEQGCGTKKRFKFERVPGVFRRFREFFFAF